MRRLLVLTIALLVTPALPGVAGAHVEVAPTEVPGGKPAKLNFSVGHGCDGAATTSLTVKVPNSLKRFRAKQVPGWKARSKRGQMQWTGGPLPDHELQKYPFTVTVYGKKGQRFPFKVIQGCEGGAKTAWIQVVPAGAPEPKNPAPTVTLASTAKAPAAAAPEAGLDETSAVDNPEKANSEPASSKEDDGLADALIAVMLVIGGVAVIAGFFYWLRLRSPKN